MVRMIEATKRTPQFDKSEGSKSAKFNNIAAETIETLVDVFDAWILKRMNRSSSSSRTRSLVVIQETKYEILQWSNRRPYQRIGRGSRRITRTAVTALSDTTITARAHKSCQFGR